MIVEHSDSAVVAQTGAKVETKANVAWQTIAAHYEAHPGATYTLKELAEATGLSYDSVKDATRALREDGGPMVKAEGGKWGMLRLPGTAETA